MPLLGTLGVVRTSLRPVRDTILIARSLRHVSPIFSLEDRNNDRAINLPSLQVDLELRYDHS